MKRIKQILAFGTLGLLLATALPAYGDIARPSPSPQKPRVVLHTSLIVIPDSKATEGHLQISQSSLREMRAALANTPDSESPEHQSIAQSIGRSSTRTAIAGLFMFLSLSFAGVWLARSVQTRGQKAVAALLMGAAVIGAAAIITRANAGPPSSYFWRKLPQNLSKGNPTYGSVDIEIVPDPTDGTGLRLIIPTNAER
ncbi:MAG: hypothetical protein M3Y84_00315 [Acidobacteriota bacterium]|nr:hypothetical protein [Acidobacteriota bacterium]